MKNIVYKTALVCCLILGIRGPEGFASGDQVRNAFEKTYQTWKAWVANHPYLSDYTTDKEFQSIVALGLPVVPLLVDKIEKNPDDFHLEVAVYLITKRRFDQGEWPQGKLGDSKAAAAMYVKWWKVDRFNTQERFAELLDKWKSLKSNKKDKEAHETYKRIIDLGIPVLPFLTEKVEQQPELISAISKLSDCTLPSTATVAECKQWWENNKQKFALPAQ